MASISEQASALVARFGSPLYVYDAALIEEAFRRFRSAFRYEPLDCHYAIVCNKNHYIVRLLAQQGAGIHAIVELTMSIPPQLKLRGSTEKYLLKQAVRDLLPPAIVDRPKSGMLVPVEGWFKGPLLSVARERLLDGLAGCGWFDRTYLERLLDGRLGTLRPRRGVKIWLLLTLASWLRSVKR